MSWVSSLVALCAAPAVSCGESTKPEPGHAGATARGGKLGAGAGGFSASGTRANAGEAHGGTPDNNVGGTGSNSAGAVGDRGGRQGLGGMASGVAGVDGVGGAAGEPAGGDTGAGGASAGTGTSGGAGAAPRCDHPVVPPPAPPAAGATKLPCDIYADDGGPCVAAHSTVRALYATYGGPLYQVKKLDGTTLDITAVAPGGFANAPAQDAFCGADACTISIVYDQSGHGNHLTKAPGGGAKPTPGNEANAKSLPVTFGAEAAYGLHVVPGVGYRNDDACGTAVGDDAETEYMVVAGTYYNAGCCFDYGNMERDNRDGGEGTVEAVYFGSCTIWNKGAGDGPWVMADLENGLWAGNTSPYPQNLPLTPKYVTGLVKADAAGKNHWTLKSADAGSGLLTTVFDGARPSSRYNPMRKQGAIGLGIGGDNSNSAQGNFFEGVMTSHYSSDAADNAVQANLVSVYGGG